MEIAPIHPRLRGSVARECVVCAGLDPRDGDAYVDDLGRLAAHGPAKLSCRGRVVTGSPSAGAEACPLLLDASWSRAGLPIRGGPARRPAPT